MFYFIYIIILVDGGEVMYKLMDTVIARVKKQGKCVRIDTSTINRCWCAVNEDEGIAFNLEDFNYYEYLNTINGIYLSNDNVINNAFYAIHATDALITPSDDVKKRFKDFTLKEDNQKRLIQKRISHR